MSTGAFASKECGVKDSEMAIVLAILWSARLWSVTHPDGYVARFTPSLHISTHILMEIGH